MRVFWTPFCTVAVITVGLRCGTGFTCVCICVYFCVCVCPVRFQHTQTDAMIRRVLSKTARLQDGRHYGPFVVVTTTCTTVGWQHCLWETLLPSHGTFRNLYLLFVRFFCLLLYGQKMSFVRLFVSTEQSPSFERSRPSATPKIPNILCSSKVQFSHNPLPLALILSRMNPYNSISSYFSIIPFNIITPPTYTCCRWSLSFRFPRSNPVLFPISATCLLWFAQPDGTS